MPHGLSASASAGRSLGRMPVQAPFQRPYRGVAGRLCEEMRHNLTFPISGRILFRMSRNSFVGILPHFAWCRLGCTVALSRAADFIIFPPSRSFVRCLPRCLCWRFRNGAASSTDRFTGEKLHCEPECAKIALLGCLLLKDFNLWLAKVLGGTLL